MTGVIMIVGYSVSIIIVVGLVFAYKKYLNNNDNKFSTTVSNMGKPIKGGVKHIKIICE